MKKILFMVLFFATITCNAQVILWNGEDKELGSDGGFWNRADPTVVEENGNKCLKVTLKSNPGGWDQEHHNAALPVGDANFKGLHRISFRLKMSDKHNVMLQLEGKDGAYNAKRVFWYDTPDEWQTMVYDYSVGPENEKISETGNNVIAIWPFEETADGEGKTIYIDDIQLNGPMVNDMAVRSYGDNSLSGEVKVTGNIEVGHYQNTWDGDWHGEDFSDYAVIAAKLASDATILDVTGATYTDPDWENILTKCQNIIIKLNDGGTITGVNTIQCGIGEEPQGNIFNLAGQPVKQTQKGLFIVNGKKKVIK